MKKHLPLLLASLIFFSCQQNETADTILTNGNFYTVNDAQPQAEAIAIKGDRILKVGSEKEVEKYKGAATKTIDLDGKFAMPGFIEGHGHFSGLGNSLMILNFMKVKSWDEIVAMVAAKAKEAKPGEWITGRGWHQEKWTKPPDRQVLGYPFHDKLSAVSPNNPVLLRHASGHALFANKAAMDAAGITLETPNPTGGEIVRDAKGKAIGVFEERAMGAINQAYQAYLKTLSKDELTASWYQGIKLAQQDCLSKGITSFLDAGSSFEEIERYRKMAENGKLDLRLWAMIRHSSDRLKGNLDGFPIINVGNHFFTSRAIKAAIDGALGSFGAWLLEPYNDKPGFVGQNTTSIPEMKKIAAIAIKHDLQFCIHAIGDRANREVLDIYEEIFKAHPEKKDLRWRIEHAQHLAPSDIPRFKQLGVIASMQGIHCTSDAPFVVKRLGEKRAREGAYAWRSLLNAGAVVGNGTDVPVEDANPIACFYATVTRKRADNGMEFFPEQKMTRKEAIHSHTLANAYSAFEEKDKGSLEEGKLADIVVLSNDLTSCSEADILKTEVLMTMVGGEMKFEKK